MEARAMFILPVIPFPAINPVLIHIGPLAVRWYALAYIVGIPSPAGSMHAPSSLRSAYGTDRRRSPCSTSTTS